MEKIPEHIKKLIAVIPEKPGCYQHYDEKGDIIYIGKAKNLKKRVSSYFIKEQESRKTRVLVKQIRDIKYIVVNNEEDALLLENNLIKQYKPRYNVLLKDDKTYPSIVIKNEYFPRVIQTRSIIRDGSSYFGPYPSVWVAKNMLEMIKNIHPLRTCKLPLTPEGIAQGRYKECLEYHIKRCKAPCIGLQSSEDYLQSINEIREILKGNISHISKEILKKMQTCAEEMRFEEAQKFKEKFEIIENYRAKSTVVPPMLHNIDVFSIEENENSAYINFLHIGKGAIVQAYTFEYKKRLDETKEELLELGIVEMRQRFKSTAREIIVPFTIAIEIEGVSFQVPQRGDRKKLLDLSLLNVKQHKIEQLKFAEKLNPEQRNTRIMKDIQNALGLTKLPMRIEAFDNSNLQGSNAVAACVVFIKTKPAKSEYRKYNIKTVDGPDDYASMKEVLRRRYKKTDETNPPLPDLIIIDGGKGQMESARSVIEDELNLNIAIAGLAKDKKHRTAELLFGNPPINMGISPKSPLFRLLEQIQNEVHRFAITFHKDKRSKSQVKSQIDNIKGIGEKTKVLLLHHYKSVKRIREAEAEEIEKLIGKSKTKALLEALNKKEE